MQPPGVGRQVIAVSKGKAIGLLPLCVDTGTLMGWIWGSGAIAWSETPFIVQICVVLGIGICVAAFFVVSRKLIGGRPGLIIDERGICCDPLSPEQSMVYWKDVTGFGVFKYRRRKWIIITLIDPDDYIRRGGIVRSLVAKANDRLTGSPVSISTQMLQIRFDDLLALVQDCHRTYCLSHPALPAAN